MSQLIGNPNKTRFSLEYREGINGAWFIYDVYDTEPENQLMEPRKELVAIFRPNSYSLTCSVLTFSVAEDTTGKFDLGHACGTEKIIAYLTNIGFNQEELGEFAKVVALVELRK